MKISKVEHKRAGVGIEECQSKGMLYDNPKNEKKGSGDLTEHVEKLNDKARKLYSVFVINKLDFTRSGEERKQCKAVKGLMCEIVKKAIDRDKAESGLKDQLKNLKQWIDEVYKENSGYASSFAQMDSALIDTFVDGCLRNSLRKTVKPEHSMENIYFPDLVKKFLKCISRKGGAGVEGLTEAEREAFLTELNRDYWKTEEIKKIVHSIESQNVHVQSMERDGRHYLQLSSAENEKKQYIFQFLAKFANAGDDVEWEKLLVQFKRLVLLFYCGRDQYKETASVPMSAWSWGTYKEDDAVNFDGHAYELINKRAFQQGRDSKSKKRQIDDEIKKSLREQIISHYRDAVQIEGITEEDIFWLKFIQKSAEKMLLSKSDLSPVRLSVSYLCDHTYKEWISYLCMKYIDMGKGVYHFATPEDLAEVIRGDKIVGEVLPEYQNGITSFDYERIKAEESLDRDISYYIIFAVNNYARAVLSRKEIEGKKGGEDILSFKNDDLKKKLDVDAERKLLQFFGGKSTWKGIVPEKVDGIELAMAVKNGLRALRNSSFHYAAGVQEDGQEYDPVLLNMFQTEYSRTGEWYKKKYLTNNVLLFYPPGKVQGLMDYLYHGSKERPAQIPAFNRIINKANLGEFLTEYISAEERRKLETGENSLERMEKFRASLFFVLKEIYYYGFLQEDNIKEMFMKAVNIGEKKGRYPGKEKFANDNFKKRLKEITKKSGTTFGEICQQIMTDYNQQNQGKKSITSNDKGHEEEKYKHFRMLLYLYTKNAFIQYLRDHQKQYGFLQMPENREAVTDSAALENFGRGWQPSMYDALQQDISQDSMLLAWYTTAHFLNAKQLNLLIGSVRNYIQFIRDIDKRAHNTGNRVAGKTEAKAARYRKILSVLEFVMLFSGNVTNCMQDYFADEDDYARHLADYVEFDLDGKKDSAALRAFCDRKVKKGSPNGKIGLYYDGLNPIINKNIVYARMYGNEKLFRNCFTRIQEKDIKEYYEKLAKLSSVFQSGRCENVKQEQDLRRFQNKKNHIELMEITTYSEIVNDFMGQLVSWAYLRERDLMYFQLGFHYMRLYYGDSVEKDSKYRRLEGEQVNIQEGAILYQIIAMYTYDFSVYAVDKDASQPWKVNENVKKSDTIGAKVGKFCGGYCHDKGDVYMAGLCLFEAGEKEHEEMSAFRNYIDHFHYYSHLDRSIMELYSDVYDRYLNYDLKLKKSVSYIFKNILMRYFVKSRTRLSTGMSKRYDKPKETLRAARLSIEEDGLSTDKYKASGKYKDSSNANGNKKQELGGGNKKQEPDTMPARDKNFLEQLQRILEYKEE